MPKVSKVKVPTSKAPDAQPAKEKPNYYMCTRCGALHKKQKGVFAASHSPLFRENNGYLPVCNKCLEDLFEHYKNVLGSKEAAIERVCLKFDIYWSREIFKMVDRSNSTSSYIRSYISRTNLYKYAGKTYDSTIDETGGFGIPVKIEELAAQADEDEEGSVDCATPVASPIPIPPPTADTVLFWGAGFNAAFYHELNLRYERWTKDLPKPIGIAEEALYKQICLQEATINKNIASNKSIEQGQNALNNLLGSLNAKPIQKKEDDSGNSELENTPLGVWTKRWEDRRPLPEDKHKNGFADMLRKYLNVWVYGHLGKSLGLRNTYCQLYEDEIAKYRVEKPELADDSDDQLIADLFGDSDNGDMR